MKNTATGAHLRQVYSVAKTLQLELYMILLNYVR